MAWFLTVQVSSSCHSSGLHLIATWFGFCLGHLTLIRFFEIFLGASWRIVTLYFMLEYNHLTFFPIHSKLWALLLRVLLYKVQTGVSCKQRHKYQFDL
jgi:hypothetical protein